MMDSFIKQFYEMMAKKPWELHRFYKDSSSFTHCEGQQVLHCHTFANLNRFATPMLHSIEAFLTIRLPYVVRVFVMFVMFVMG